MQHLKEWWCAMYAHLEQKVALAKPWAVVYCIQCSVASTMMSMAVALEDVKAAPLVNLQMKLEEQCVQHVHGDTTKMRLSNHRAKYVQSVNLQM